MRKVLGIIASLMILLSLLPMNQASASTYTQAEKLVTEAEQWAGALKWEISLEYRKTKYPNDPITYPNMDIYNNTKEPMLAAEKLLPSLSSIKRNELRKRIDNNVKVHYLRAQAYIDAITSGRKILDKTNYYNKLYVNSPISDPTVQAYHDLSSEIRKQAVLLYRVYGQSTRDAILEKYKTPGETARQNTIYTITAKMEFDKLKEMKRNGELLEDQIDVVSALIEKVENQNAKTLLESNLIKLLIGDVNNLHVDFIDVGQGDSIFVRMPNGTTMLVDGGDQSSGMDVVNHLKNEGLEKIDVVVATHPDPEHIGGLIDVLNEFPVGKVIDSGKTDTSDTYLEYKSLIDQKNIPFEVAEEGDLIDLDPTVHVEVLNSGANSSNMNDASVVLMVSHGEVDYLLTGDAGVGVEERLIQEYDLDAEVLKVGDHGSSTSTSQAFLEAVNPYFGILSYGEGNQSGDPQSEVYNRLINYGVDLISTIHGSIEMSDDGDYIYIDQHDTNNPAPEADISLTGVNLDTEVVTLKNNGSEDVNMTDWKLVSVEGNQTYDFPDDFILKAGSSVNVTSGGNAVNNPPTTLKWTDAYIWNNSGDSAQLYNSQGELVSEF
ncbi:lamin tail domain-containing protein [Rossellomorea vietnamensis]|uniref:lamin tail domain-containing protein n=1 Tax=Rossellomorea vietnamensis TaxID=218284 RepID=UPI003D2AEFA8